MCRGINRIRRAFADLARQIDDAKVTKQYAVVEKNGNTINLTTFFVVYNDREAKIYDVDRNGNVNYDRIIQTYSGMGKKRILAECDSEGAHVLSF